jgi:quinol monooxygenase YgiN
MPVVVAIQTPKPGRLQEVLDAFAVVSPLVHQEPGCELYAAHTDGRVCVMVERWTTQADLDAHAAGEPLARLIALWGDALEKPYDVWVLENVPLGDALKGTVQ